MEIFLQKLVNNNFQEIEFWRNFSSKKFQENRFEIQLQTIFSGLM